MWTCPEEIIPQDDVELPSATDVNSWQKKLNTLTDIQPYDVFIYLMTYCIWENHRLQNYKHAKGFRFFQATTLIVFTFHQFLSMAICTLRHRVYRRPDKAQIHTQHGCWCTSLADWCLEDAHDIVWRKYAVILIHSL